MTNKKRILSIFLVVLLVVMLVGCTDQKSYNDKFTVLFYTGIPAASIEPTTIDPLFEIEDGSLIEKPEDPTAIGAVFEGWYKDVERTIAWDFDTDRVTSSIVLYSKWDIESFDITYVFDEIGAEFLTTPVYEFEVTQVDILPRAGREGSLFLGWILTPVEEYKVGDTIVATTETFTGDTTIYALFENNEYTVRFKALLEGVSNPKTHTVVYSEPIDWPVLEDTATKTFVGWFSLDGSETGEWGYQYENDDPFAGKAVYNETTEEWEFVAQGITVYAKWEDK